MHANTWGDDFDIEKHFTPKYRPWQQRLAFIPDGDLFQGIAAGKASVVTDTISCFTESGILLESGQEIEADIIVTATGFDLCVMGDIRFSVDGEAVNFADHVGYRGLYVQRCTQHGLGVRVLPRQLDIACGSDF